ncbi:MAG: hypothetical protein DWQ36_19655 [Acidobacteria bacterium]|nr:MAG: hypothetical protein DWQ30_05985 [Acidobacteriota bacterium]REK03756.1 MAG: hypothetical protein DWQ36_19655 [Acidobacteriota bacterium]
MLFKGVEAWISERAGRLKSWRGRFSAPQSLEVLSLVSHDGQHRIQLDDGREGNIIVLKAPVSVGRGVSGMTTVEFTGTGSLERPAEEQDEGE